MPFTHLGLSGPIARAVATRGYSAPSPIQAQAIPLALQGRDLLASAQTGTGKTGAFALPILHRLAEAQRSPGHTRPRRSHPRALVLCPTRELAEQVHDSFVHYGANLRLAFATVYGGVSQHKQTRALARGVDVVVATPGRLLDLINQGHLKLADVKTLVLDEADQMLDMGFVNDIRKIVAMTPRERQTLFFSATMPPAIQRLTEEILTDAVRVQTAPTTQAATDIDQVIYKVNHADKPEALRSILSRNPGERAIVFVRTKHGADKLAKKLDGAGLAATSIHGNKTQRARQRALESFRRGETPVLVATDVAARGIDVKDVARVINVELPANPETYIHRIGRTARAGASGLAISFCDRAEVKHLRAIERLLGDKLPLRTLDGSMNADTARPTAKPAHDRAEQSDRSEPDEQPEQGDRNVFRNKQGKGPAQSGRKPGDRPRPGGNSQPRGKKPHRKGRPKANALAALEAQLEDASNERQGRGVRSPGASTPSKPSKPGRKRSGSKPGPKSGSGPHGAQKPGARKPGARKQRPGKRARQANRQHAG
ncbi:MAG: DEAD/DEAH box helicase [Phycisphaerales bacterium JB040]